MSYFFHMLMILFYWAMCNLSKRAIQIRKNLFFLRYKSSDHKKISKVSMRSLPRMGEFRVLWKGGGGEHATEESSGDLKTQKFHPMTHYGAISTKLWSTYHNQCFSYLLGNSTLQGICNYVLNDNDYTNVEIFL